MPHFTGRNLEQLAMAEQAVTDLRKKLNTLLHTWETHVESELLPDDKWVRYAFEELDDQLKTPLSAIEEAKADSPEARAEAKAKADEKSMLRWRQLGR